MLHSVTKLARRPGAWSAPAIPSRLPFSSGEIDRQRAHIRRRSAVCAVLTTLDWPIRGFDEVHQRAPMFPAQRHLDQVLKLRLETSDVALQHSLRLLGSDLHAFDGSRVAS